MESLSKTFEGFNLFNPSFSGIVIGSTVASFAKEAGSGMPFPLLAMILPIVLHGETRRTLPSSSKTSMLAWLQQNGHLKINFHMRCKAFLPASFDGISFLAANNKLQLSDDAKVSASQIRAKRDVKFSDEMAEIIKAAAFIGKWMANSGTTGTIFSMWGIRP